MVEPGAARCRFEHRAYDFALTLITRTSSLSRVMLERSAAWRPLDVTCIDNTEAVAKSPAQYNNSKRVSHKNDETLAASIDIITSPKHRRSSHGFPFCPAGCRARSLYSSLYRSGHPVVDDIISWAVVARLCRSFGVENMTRAAIAAAIFTRPPSDNMRSPSCYRLLNKYDGGRLISQRSSVRSEKLWVSSVSVNQLRELHNFPDVCS